MFKHPGFPTVRASAHELADFAELTAWRDGGISMTSLSRTLQRIEDNDFADGVPEEDPTDRRAEEAYSEMEARRQACGGNANYPFLINDRGRLARCTGEFNCRQLVYLYLLLATRLNMSKNRRHAEIDGANLYEKLCAGVAKTYLGLRAESMVFGTASGIGGFRDRVMDLCQKLGEGGSAKEAVSPSARDGKLDIVAWKPFVDSWQGKLIIFGQCKTGTEYRDTLTQLQPDAFCAKWLRERPAIPPMRAFFISEALSRSGASARRQWYEHSTDAGLLFDRCRIVDFCDGVTDDVLEEVRTWTGAAAENNELPAP